MTHQSVTPNKGPLSYDNCKECVSKCEHAGKDRTFCYRGKSCKVTKPITNADRVRAMSDDDLAYWILCPYDSPICDGTEHNCLKCTKEWLQQPTEEPINNESENEKCES